MTNLITTQFEVRTSKVLVSIFDTEELAKKWLQKQELKSSSYANTLKLFKVTTQKHMEVVK